MARLLIALALLVSASAFAPTRMAVRPRAVAPKMSVFDDA